MLICAKRNLPQSLLISFKRPVSTHCGTQTTMSSLTCTDKVSTTLRESGVKVKTASTSHHATGTIMVGQTMLMPGRFRMVNSTTPEGHSNLPGTTTTGDSPTFSTKMTTTQD